MMMLGSALVSGNALAFFEVGFVFALYTYKAKIEETFLVEHFKDQYKEYILTTNMILPYLI